MLANLTILIPTWDRPEDVNLRLQEIDHLWKGEIPVRVQVNPGKHSAKDINSSLYSGPIEICENKANCGFCGNMVLGVQGVDTDWLWILGDDDSLRPQARQMVEQAIQSAAEGDCDAILFNQWNLPHVAPSVLCTDLATFTQVTGFGNSLFISANIWRTSFFQSRLGLLIEFSLSEASQVLLYLTALQEQASTFLVRNESLIDYVYSHRWNRIGYLKRVFFLFRHPGVFAERELLMDFIWPQARWALQSALHEQVKNGDATLPEWMASAWEVSCYQFRCLPPLKALKRTWEIWTAVLDVYSPGYLFAMVWQRLRRLLVGRQPVRTSRRHQELGL